MIASGQAIAIVDRAIVLPNSLTVKSVAITTKGKVNAAQVSLNQNISTGMFTKPFETVITIT